MPGWTGGVSLLTRTGLDWTHKYPAIAAAVASLPARQAYLDGELSGLMARPLVQPDPERIGYGQRRCSRLFPVRSPPPPWRSHRRESAQTTEGAPSLAAVGRDGPASIQRSPDRARAGFLRPRLRPEAGRDRLEANRVALCPRQSRPVDQGQMPEPRGVRGGGLDRSRRRPALARGAAARLLRSGWPAGLCRPRPAPVSTMPSLNACGAVCNRWRRPTCRSMSR